MLPTENPRKYVLRYVRHKVCHLYSITVRFARSQQLIPPAERVAAAKKLIEPARH
jgi:hypothetical protein